jgi:hypothetical protein
MSVETQNISRLVREAPGFASLVEMFAGDGEFARRLSSRSRQLPQ